MNNYKTIYQYAIKTDGQKTVLVDMAKKATGKTLPIAVDYRDAEAAPAVTAGLLRDLAKYAIEMAEIIDELETGKPILERSF